MKYLGQISDPKDFVNKEYVDDVDTALSTRIDTNEDNIAMAESDIESLQGDVNTLKTDNTATKAAVKTLQDTYVPNTRKVNNKALDADITLNASDVNALATVSNATENHIPTFTSTGQLQDSGKTLDDLGGMFIVNLSFTGGVAADKTYAEIKSAHEAGKNVQLVYDNVVFDYIAITKDDSLWFAGSVPYTSQLDESIITVTDTYGLLSVNSSDKWQIYTQSFVPKADTEGNILMVDIVGGDRTWKSVTPTYVSAQDVVDTETTTSIDATTLEGQNIGYFAPNELVQSLKQQIQSFIGILNGLSRVATTGSYNDLTDQPTIPTIYSGTTDPSASLGQNGDIYIKYSG